MSDHLLERLIRRYPALADCASDIAKAGEMLVELYHKNGTLFICGNGGSSADSLHIVGELMKGFQKKRPVSPAQLPQLDEKTADHLAKNLQGALPALALGGNNALSTAFGNDVHPDYVFAQEIFGLGKPDDILLGISTSGHSTNVLHAIEVAHGRGLKTIGLTGGTGGQMVELCDTAIIVPAETTPDIQEFHLPIYHYLCEKAEEVFFHE
ncbi:D-sedoheptulose-7-phosphate isomerase [Listeria costaricensis]|uniref:D-sedoheptulose-7-phosphate isomerase n=1 Tax=Listeria costaricensis TaxID=2026604 RepID=UPI000C06EF9E|nr:SIS domain-containing protein [Listeria costaricensis]